MIKSKRFSSLTALSIALVLFAWPVSAMAVMADTLPMGAFLLDESLVVSWLSERWDNNGKRAELIDEIVRYDPGGGVQGTIRPEPKARVILLVNKLQYGILDDLTLGLGIPVVLSADVDPNLQWTPGSYQRQIGREYSQEDFWEWAESMGQSKPQSWSGNQGEISDIVLGLRYRWTHRIPVFKEIGLQSALSIFGVIPTGKNADPEEIVSAGTSLWDLHFQGDLSFHLSFDKTFEESLDGRLALGLDLFYETFFERTLTSPVGKIHPLMRNLAPYIGKSYKVDPGDFSGFAFEVAVVPWKGPALGTWLVKGDVEKAEKLPPLLTLAINYQFVHLQQTDWTSDYDMWDYEQEDLWRPGYKNMLTGKLSISLLRVGAPLQLYVHYRTLRAIPGKNTRSPDILTTGLQVFMKFW